MSVTCPICNLKKINHLYTLYDDRYGYAGTSELLKCKNCDHGFLGESLTDDQISLLYSHYYPRSRVDPDNYSPYTEQTGLLAWLDGSRANAYTWVPGNCKILDIGCGSGESIGYHKSRGCDVYGVEADKDVVQIAEKYQLKISCGQFDANAYQPDFFDYVTLDQVIEHMNDPERVLKQIYEILRPAGQLVMSTPNINGWGKTVFGRKWINWHAPYHLHFFSRASIELLAEKCGYKLKLYKTITPADWLTFQWMHLITYPEQGTKSGYWSDNSPCMQNDMIFLRLLRKLDQLKINHLITRFFDAIGLGDNSLIILEKHGR